MSQAHNRWGRQTVGWAAIGWAGKQRPDCGGFAFVRTRATDKKSTSGLTSSPLQHRLSVSAQCSSSPLPPLRYQNVPLWVSVTCNRKNRPVPLHFRSDTVVAVWWQGETLFIRCFDVGDGSVTVSALYREPQGASPLPLGAYSPVAAYNDHLMFVAWTATETVEGRPVDTVRGGCFFASADSAPRRLHTLRVSASDAAGPGQPSVALLGPRFVVAWAHHNTTCRGCVYVRSYAAADGRPVPGVALAAAPPYGTVFRAPAITAVSETVFLVVWIGLQARECSLWGRVFVDHVPLEDRAFIIRRTAYSRCQAVASASAAGESVLALYNGDEALREGLELAILRSRALRISHGHCVQT